MGRGIIVLGLILAGCGGKSTAKPAEKAGVSKPKKKEKIERAKPDEKLIDNTASKTTKSGDVWEEANAFGMDRYQKILVDMGMGQVEVDADGDIKFKMFGNDVFLRRYRDGDISLLYGAKLEFAPSCKVLEIVNEWNRDHRLSSAFVAPKDAGVLLQADLLSDGGLSERKVVVFIKTFGSSLTGFQNLILKSC